MLSKSCVVLAVLLFACGDRRAKPDAAPAQVATIEEKPVTAEEFEELAALVERDCKRAPRRGDPRLRRLTDPRNFPWLADPSAPPSVQMDSAAAWMLTPQRLVAAYVKCGATAETLETTAYFLELGVAVGGVVDAFLATLPADDPSRAERNAMRVEMAVGEGQVIWGDALMLRELATSNAVAATELATRIGAAAARLRREGPAIDQAIDRVRAMVVREQDATKRAVLQAMLDAATAPAPAP